MKTTNSKPKTFYETYRALEEAHPGHIVAYRLGDFYEVIGQYAKPLSELLDLTLTGRNRGDGNFDPMIGFPYHRSEDIFYRIVTAGYSLVIVDSPTDIRVAEPATVNYDEVMDAFYESLEKDFDPNDCKEYRDPDHGKVVGFRADPYHRVAIYEDGYEDRDYMGD